MKPKKIVILDRDGVINYHSKFYVKNTKEFRMINKSSIGMSKIFKKGFYIAIATNQSAVGRGLMNKSSLDKIHSKLIKEVKKFGVNIFYIASCTHHPKVNCNCRKPKTGLIEEILNFKSFNYTEKWLIGDNLSDLVAGQKKGFNLILLKTGLGKETLYKIKSQKIDIKFTLCEDLYEASKIV